MKILLTGGAGFIGSHIADACLKAGHEVVIIDNLSTGRRENIPTQARFHEISILDPALEKIIRDEKPDIINHQAAQISIDTAIREPVLDAQINILASIQLMEWAVKYRCRKFVFASSAAVYGSLAPTPTPESAPTLPEHPYGIGKLTVEHYLDFYQQHHHLPVCIFRYANVYGPRQNHLGEAGVICVFITQLLGEKPMRVFGEGTQTRDFVFVEDIASLHVKALASEWAGTFNLGTGTETSIWSLAEQIHALQPSSPKPQHGPARSADQARSALIKSLIQTEKMTGLTEGLQKTCAWFEKNLEDEIL